MGSRILAGPHSWISPSTDRTNRTTVAIQADILRDPHAVAIGIGIYFDHDPLDGGTWRLAAADRLHLDKSRCFQFCQGACEVRRSSSGDLREFCNRSGLAVADNGKQLPVSRRQ